VSCFLSDTPRAIRDIKSFFGMKREITTRRRRRKKNVAKKRKERKGDETDSDFLTFPSFYEISFFFSNVL
jgi:hypothetical protein